MSKETEKVVRTADVLATINGEFVLIERLKPPFGLALPGGHVERGERPRDAAIREFNEETGLKLFDVRFALTRKGKRRDLRYPISATRVFTGNAHGTPKNECGHTKVILLSKKALLDTPSSHFAFDHHTIVMRLINRSNT